MIVPVSVPQRSQIAGDGQSGAYPALGIDTIPGAFPASSLSHEPKIFPGVVAAIRRRSSVSKVAAPAMAEVVVDAMRSSTGSLKRDGDGLTIGAGLLDGNHTIEEARDQEEAEKD